MADPLDKAVDLLIPEVEPPDDRVWDPEKGAFVGERRPGYPRFFSVPGRKEALFELLRKGVPRRKALDALGVKLGVLTRAMRDDPAFKVEVHQAQTKAIVDATTCVVRAAKTDWKAAAWFLERAAPEDFGERKELRIGPTVKRDAEAAEAAIAKLLGTPEPAALPAAPASPEALPVPEPPK